MMERAFREVIFWLIYSSLRPSPASTPSPWSLAAKQLVLLKAIAYEIEAMGLR
jgi:hypothetical protein